MNSGRQTPAQTAKQNPKAISMKSVLKENLNKEIMFKGTTLLFSSSGLTITIQKYRLTVFVSSSFIDKLGELIIFSNFGLGERIAKFETVFKQKKLFY